MQPSTPRSCRTQAQELSSYAQLPTPEVGSFLKHLVRNDLAHSEQYMGALAISKNERASDLSPS
jgi:Mn-containing catalase